MAANPDMAPTTWVLPPAMADAPHGQEVRITYGGAQLAIIPLGEPRTAVHTLAMLLRDPALLVVVHGDTFVAEWVEHGVGAAARLPVPRLAASPSPNECVMLLGIVDEDGVHVRVRAHIVRRGLVRVIVSEGDPASPTLRVADLDVKVFQCLTAAVPDQADASRTGFVTAQPLRIDATRPVTVIVATSDVLDDDLTEWLVPDVTDGVVETDLVGFAPRPTELKVAPGGEAAVVALAARDATHQVAVAGRGIGEDATISSSTSAKAVGAGGGVTADVTKCRTVVATVDARTRAFWAEAAAPAVLPSTRVRAVAGAAATVRAAVDGAVVLVAAGPDGSWRGVAVRGAKSLPKNPTSILYSAVASTTPAAPTRPSRRPAAAATATLVTWDRGGAHVSSSSTAEALSHAGTATGASTQALVTGDWAETTVVVNRHGEEVTSVAVQEPNPARDAEVAAVAADAASSAQLDQLAAQLHVGAYADDAAPPPPDMVVTATTIPGWHVLVATSDVAFDLDLSDATSVVFLDPTVLMASSVSGSTVLVRGARTHVPVLACPSHVLIDEVRAGGKTATVQWRQAAALHVDEDLEDTCPWWALGDSQGVLPQPRPLPEVVVRDVEAATPHTEATLSDGTRVRAIAGHGVVVGEDTGRASAWILRETATRDRPFRVLSVGVGPRDTVFVTEDCVYSGVWMWDGFSWTVLMREDNPRRTLVNPRWQDGAIEASRV